MSGLQNFLAPFSHLLFANRNVVIVLICAVAFWAAIQALKDRWRADRLERDLSSARSNASSAPAGLRYPNGAPEETGMEGGGALPPVKGGRTYARNLGTALQKAGMSGPQIYSPPTPSGFSPNTNPMQPGIGQPGPGSPYGAPSAPWGSPSTAPAPWGFPAGAARNGPAPAPVPFYQPQPGPQQAPPSFPTPAQSAPNAGPPPTYGPPAAPPTFTVPQPGQYPAAAPINGAPAQAPQYGSQPPMGPLMPPPSGMPPIAPPAQQDDADSSRRGKPKRRRFNFNVLENLEKMVQQKPSEAAVAPGVPTPSTPAPLPIPAASPNAPVPVPTAASTSRTGPGQATPTVPFLFGQRAEEAKPAPSEEKGKASSEPAPQAPVEQALPLESDEVVSSPQAVEEAAVEGSEPKEGRRSMRSMMFGEEIASASASKAAAELAADSAQSSDTETVEAESGGAAAAWPSEPWTNREDVNPAAPDEAPAEAAEEPSSTSSQDSDSALKPFGSYDPWKPVEPSDTEASIAEGDQSHTEEQSEPAPVESAAEAPAPVAETALTDEETMTPSRSGSTDEVADVTSEDIPQAPPMADGDRPSGGTLVIIEDDETAASYYATLFRGNGYQVEVANDGVSGVDLCAKVQPQVILLDVMMPRQNGILVLQTLRASDETKNTPVVVMSNFSEPTLIKRAIQLGALEYVIKTQVEGAALLNALPRWMNREKAFAA